MCGRFGCSLGDEDLSCATCHKDPNTGLYVKTPCSFKDVYKPSCNIPPTLHAPIIINENKKAYNPTIVLARFGAVPPWVSSTESSEKSKFETHLCRFESMSNSVVYSCLFNNGWRCVIPCTAYFEWQTTKGPNKQPYCFFDKNNDSENLFNTTGTFSEHKGWRGVKLLYLAGLYSINLDNQTNEKQYSFAIITQETNEDWKWVHHRMPMVLQSDEDVRDWLDSNKILKDEALKIITKPIKNLSAHAVDKAKVNNPKNNTGIDCFKKFEQKKSNFMNQWLQTTPTSKKPSNKNIECTAKTAKSKTNFMSQWLVKPGSKDESQKQENKIEKENENCKSAVSNCKKRPSLSMENKNAQQEKKKKYD